MSGCIRLPSEVFAYLRTLSRTSALEVYLFLAKEGALETWTPATKSGLGETLAKSRNTISESLAVLLELGLVKERLGIDGTEYSIPSGVCTTCGITCGKPQFLERLEDSPIIERPREEAQVDGTECSVSEQASLILLEIEENEAVAEDEGILRPCEEPQVDEGECSVSEQQAGFTPISQSNKNIGNKETDLKTLDLDLDLKTFQPTRPSRLQQVFDHWNSKEIVRHRFITPDMEKRINKRLQELDTAMLPDDSLAEALKAIDNYATCLLDENYRWTFKWELATFFMRENGFHKFRDEAQPLERERVVAERRPTRDFTAARGADAFAGL